MIIAVTAIVHGYELLPYYLEYYRELGVEEFVISCDPEELDESGELGTYLAAQADVKLLPLPRTFRRSKLVGMIEEEIRKKIGRHSDWLIPADLDEFNQYPWPLRDLVERLERGGYTHVNGVFSDRLAVGGELVALKPQSEHISLWDQYPMEAAVTQRIGQGQLEKVMLSRGDVGWALGHHHVSARPDLKPHPDEGVVHHFKWRDTVLRTLNWRVSNEEKVGTGLPWVGETIRMREYLRQHGRIRYEDVGATPGWRPSARAARG
jgi:hypothetical protein